MPGPLTFNINAARAQAGLADTMNAFRPQQGAPQAAPGFQQIPQPQATGMQVNPYSRGGQPGMAAPMGAPPVPQAQPMPQYGRQAPGPQMQPGAMPQMGQFPPMPRMGQFSPMPQAGQAPTTYQPQSAPQPFAGPRGAMQPQMRFYAQALGQLLQSGQINPQALQQLMARYR